MKLIKRFILTTLSIYLVNLIVSGMHFAKGLESLVITGAILTLASFIIKPILNLLLLPLNLITFGLFRWVTYAITLYIVTMIAPGFSISGFSFAGFSTYWFDIPSFFLPGVLGILAFSLSISFVHSLFSILMK